MSYCRWSSDNWRCPLYCYEGTDGFVTHVAVNQIVGEIPPEPPVDLIQTNAGEYMKQHRAVMDFLDTAERVPIGLKYDGETFDDPDLETFLQTVVMLKDAGYAVPEWLLDSIREELKEASGEID